MIISKSMPTIFFVGFLFLSLFSCNDSPTKNDSPEGAELGTISIDITCAENAIDFFNEGLLLLHSFQFDDAEEKFVQAQNIDPQCAMAYWGEAMSENHPLWREQAKEEALQALRKLGNDSIEQRLKFKTEFEKDMFDAICVLYGNGTKKENDKAYAAFMKSLYEKYPKNHEVRAFYALSLLGSVEDGRDEKLYSKGAKIAQSIIDENPQHPGALHYLIHGYDDPTNAHKALEAANSYAKVAPDAAHALHMPSHIYVALGMWNEVISSNQAAVKASVDRKERKDLTNKAIDFHSLKWLMYGHLQRGEFDQARTLVQQMEEYCEEEQSPKAVSHTVMMKAAYFTETNSWNDSLRYDDVDYSDLPLQIYGTKCFINGMHAYEENKKDVLLDLIDDLESEISNGYKDALSNQSAMCSGNYKRGRTTKNHVKRTEVVQHQLKALVAMLENDKEKVESHLKDAVEKEEETSYTYGPPEIVKPSHEMYAEWLEQNGNTQKAKMFFEKVLDRAPGRRIAMEGVRRLEGE